MDIVCFQTFQNSHFLFFIIEKGTVCFHQDDVLVGLVSVTLRANPIPVWLHYSYNACLPSKLQHLLLLLNWILSLAHNITL